ncbi:MAG: mechanosensitive ion channel [Pirellulaceae bacterium]|nr:mechanosensitive ion channel [Planctomycetales bacterium]
MTTQCRVCSTYFDVSVSELRFMSVRAIQMSPLVLLAIAVLAVTWAMAQLARQATGWGLRNRITNVLLRIVAAQLAMLPRILIGIYVVLRVSGLTQLALTVLGGTGIAGLIIGIAFRDIAENFLASILISTQNPFRNEDGENLLTGQTATSEVK